MEILKNTPAMGNLIRNSVWQQIQSDLEAQAKEGMATLERSLIKLVDQGLITQEETLHHADTTSIRSQLAR